jgi:hypothetical protein
LFWQIKKSVESVKFDEPRRSAGGGEEEARRRLGGGEEEARRRRGGGEEEARRRRGGGEEEARRKRGGVRCPCIFSVWSPCHWRVKTFTSSSSTSPLE